MMRGYWKFLFAGSLIAVVVVIGLWLVSNNLTLQQPPQTVAPLQPVETTRRASLASGLKPPETMDEWIKGSAIIVEGTVEQVVKDGYSTGFDPTSGAALWNTTLPSPKTGSNPTPTPAPLLPHTDFKVKPDRIYRDDGTIAANKPLIISVLGRLNSPDTDQSAMPQIGQKYLFVLNQNPDKTTYASPRACGILTVTTGKLQCLSSVQELLPFMQGVTPSQFLKQLQKEAL